MSESRSQDRHDFESVLEHLHRAKANAAGTGAAKKAANPTIQSILDQLDELQMASPGVSAGWFSEWDEAEHGEPAAEPLSASDQDVVMQELGALDDRTVEDLFELRRTFARANHPDLASPALRPSATRRMAFANMLIDRALEQRRASRL